MKVSISRRLLELDDDISVNTCILPSFQHLDIPRRLSLSLCFLCLSPHHSTFDPVSRNLFVSRSKHLHDEGSRDQCASAEIIYTGRSPTARLVLALSGL